MNAPQLRTKFLTTVFVIVMLALVLVLDSKRRTAEVKLKQLSMQLDRIQPQQQQNADIAREVIARVRKHIIVPGDVEPTVATIIDVEALRERNSFYNKARNGDHLILTADRTIITDPLRDIILDVAPVQIRAAGETSP